MIDINQPLSWAILEIQRYHKTCKEKCAHSLLISKLMNYETELRNKLAQDLVDTREQWISMKEPEIGDLAKWLRTGFDISIRVLEEK